MSDNVEIENKLELESDQTEDQESDGFPKLKPGECDICGKIIGGSSATPSMVRRNLRRHKLHVHEGVPRKQKQSVLLKQPVVCYLCGKSISYGFFKQHLKNHGENPDGRVTCDQCGKEFSHAGQLRVHYRYVHEGKVREKVECEECGKEVSRNNISQHRLHAHQGLKYRTRDRTVRCPFCDLAMPRSALERHKKTLHRNEDIPKREKSHICPHCGKSFGWAHNLRDHINDSHSLENVSQEYLGKFDEEAKMKVLSLVERFDRYTVSEKLSLPLWQIRNWKDRVQCSVCSESIPRKRLTNHMKIHSGERRCVTNGERRRLVNSKHSVEEIANYAKEEGYAAAAKRFNIGEMTVKKYYGVTFNPIQCKLCDFKAAWADHMKKHILRTHKAVKDNICHLCDFKTSVYNDLTLHLKLRHNAVNPHPNRDQIHDIELVRDNSKNTTSAGEEGNVGTESSLEILRRIHEVDLELTNQKYRKKAPEEKDDYESNTIEQEVKESKTDDVNFDDDVASEEKEEEDLIDQVTHNNDEDDDDEPGEYGNDLETTHRKLLKEDLEDQVEHNNDDDELDIHETKFETADEDLEVKHNDNDRRKVEPEVYESKIFEEEDDENYESLGPDQRTTYEDGDLVITASSSGAGDESFEIKPDEDAPEFEIKIEDSDPKLEAEDQDSDFELEEQESDPDDDFEEEKPAVKEKKKAKKVSEKVEKCDEENLVCPICNKVITKYWMKGHLETHTEERKHACQLCGAKYKTKMCLRSHIWAVHAEFEEVVPCSFCGKTFPSKFKIQRHIARNHTAIQCGQCEKMLENRMKLTQHMKVEHGKQVKKAVAKTSFCDLCGKTVGSLSLKKHLAICNGTGKRRSRGRMVVTCEVCGKVFKKSYNLKVHMTKHTGVKNFACDLCDKSFVAKRTLIQHKEKNHSRQADPSCL